MKHVELKPTSKFRIYITAQIVIDSSQPLAANGKIWICAETIWTVNPCYFNALS